MPEKVSWWRRYRRNRETDDGLVGFTRSSVRVRVDGRHATVGAEMLVGRRWLPDFVVYRNDVKWDDGGPVSDEDGKKILDVLQESARRRKMTIEVE